VNGFGSGKVTAEVVVGEVKGTKTGTGFADNSVKQDFDGSEGGSEGRTGVCYFDAVTAGGTTYAAFDTGQIGGVKFFFNNAVVVSRGGKRGVDGFEG
jgi:hypothetical protein